MVVPAAGTLLMRGFYLLLLVFSFQTTDLFGSMSGGDNLLTQARVPSKNTPLGKVYVQVVEVSKVRTSTLSPLPLSPFVRPSLRFQQWT